MQDKALILIVDDVLDNLKVLSGLLKPLYRIRVATSGEDALRLAQESPQPDLILLDVMMPGMDGYSVCQRLKAMPRTQEIPVIFTTARTGEDDEERGFEVGAADFVAKPINPRLLRARIRAQLALAAQIRDSHRALEASGQHLAQLSCERDRSEVERQRLQDRQHALLAITRAALSDLSLTEYLETTLRVIDAIPWLAIEPRGALFLFNRKQQLIKVAEHRFDETSEPICASVRRGRCVCQRVATEAKPAFLALVKGGGEHCVMGRNGVGCHSVPLADADRVYGVLTVMTPPDHRPADGEIEFMTDVAQTVSSLIRRRIAEETLRISQLETQLARNEVTRRLGVAAEFRDTETGLHITRMSKYARAIAAQLGCDDAYCELIELAAPMHDVGKIGIQDSILRKPGKLTPEEFAVMQQHTLIGGRILEGDDPLIRLAHEIAVSHHEKWDGNGYPHGLAGSDIPLSGRICAVADVFDALTMERPYKSAWPVERAVEFIESASGTSFDPDAVDAFRRCLPDLLAIKARYHDEVSDPRELFPVPRELDADAWIPWRDEFAVGIEIVDEHHRYLLDWINRIHRAINSKAGTVEIAKALAALEQYARIHFQAEERLMAEDGYADIESHRQQHRMFEAELRELRVEIAHNPFIASVEMQNYLHDWLLNHILKADSLIAPTPRTDQGEVSPRAGLRVALPVWPSNSTALV